MRWLLRRPFGFALESRDPVMPHFCFISCLCERRGVVLSSRMRWECAREAARVFGQVP